MVLVVQQLFVGLRRVAEGFQHGPDTYTSRVAGAFARVEKRQASRREGGNLGSVPHRTREIRGGMMK